MSACGADGGTDADGSSPTSSVSADPPIDDGGVAALPD
jgi:hypothetical protein